MMNIKVCLYSPKDVFAQNNVLCLNRFSQRLFIPTCEYA